MPGKWTKCRVVLIMREGRAKRVQLRAMCRKPVQEQAGMMANRMYQGTAMVCPWLPLSKQLRAVPEALGMGVSNTVAPCRNMTTSPPSRT
jgi:hypothetical protein